MRMRIVWWCGVGFFCFSWIWLATVASDKDIELWPTNGSEDFPFIMETQEEKEQQEQEQEQMKSACNHPIYCNNSLLCVVQLSGLYSDSKTFVDQPLQGSVEEVLQAFEQLGPQPTVAQIASWLSAYFLPAGVDLELWTPSDFVAQPSSLLAAIKDEQLRSFAEGLVAIWPSLGRRTNASFAQPSPALQSLQGQSSLIQVPNGFVVPGGRFREYYYWDSWFILKGLLLSEMTVTARGMIANLIQIVKDVGFVPNGGRVYYLNRSQPPMLTLMMWEYWLATHDTAFVLANLPFLEQEYQFWQTQRSVFIPFPAAAKSDDPTLDHHDNNNNNNTGYQLNVYGADLNLPRPEGWVEDVNTAQGQATMAAALQLWHNIASAAETGWDFSSRWCREGANLSTLQTPTIVPVDLNALLYAVESHLAEFYLLAGQASAAASKQQAAARRLAAIEAVLWNPRVGCWNDFHLPTRSHNDKSFYISNIVPLWTHSYLASPDKSRLLLEYLTKLTGALSYPGGVPTSEMVSSAQQWDWPNAWPPEQLFIIQGLQNLPFEETIAGELAFTLAQRWITSNYLAWQATQGGMFEKYNVTHLGVPGGGGEYPTQLGFGWSNGVALQLLKQYGQQLIAPSSSSESLSSESSTSSTELTSSSISSTESTSTNMELISTSPHSILHHSPTFNPFFCQVPQQN